MKNLLLILVATCLYNIATAQIAPGKQMHGQMNMTTKTGGLGKKAKMDMNYYFSGTFIGSLADGSKEWEMIIDSMTMVGNQGDEEFDFNTNKPNDSDDGKLSALKDQVGKKVSVLITPNGDINPKDSNATVPEFLKYCFMPVPKNNQKVGYAWTKEETQNASGMELKFSSNNKITAINKNDISITSVTSVDNEMVNIDPITTNYIADAETSLVKSATTTMKMSIMKLMKMEISTNYKANW
jgi:hypothetical protein